VTSASQVETSVRQTFNPVCTQTTLLRLGFRKAIKANRHVSKIKCHTDPSRHLFYLQFYPLLGTIGSWLTSSTLSQSLQNV